MKHLSGSIRRFGRLVGFIRSLAPAGRKAKVDLLLVCHDNDRASTVDGLPYSQMVDSIAFFADALGYSTLTIAKPYSRLTGSRGYGSPVSINLASFLLTLLSYGLFGMCRRRLVLLLKTRMWVKVLHDTAPRLVIGIQPSEHLCAAGHAVGIGVYDMQHGAIARQHPWYSSRISTLEDRFLPDGFLVWDAASSSALSGALEKGLSIHIVGHPEFLRYMHVRNLGHARETGLCDDGKSVHVLVTLQWGLEDVLSAPGEAGLMCAALISAIQNSEESITWHIRMHPVQVRQNYEFVSANLRTMFSNSLNVEFDVATTTSLPELLSRMDLHITYNSTVVKEAGWLGIPSAILCPEVKDGGKLASYYFDERDSGMAQCVDCTEQAIIEWLGSRRSGTGEAPSFSVENLNIFLKEKLAEPQRRVES